MQLMYEIFLLKNLTVLAPTRCGASNCAHLAHAGGGWRNNV